MASDAPLPPNSSYEETTWQRFKDAFPWRRNAFLAWRDFHRDTFHRLLADPRLSAEAKDAVRELL